MVLFVPVAGADNAGRMLSALEFNFHPQLQAIFDHVCALHHIRIAFYAPSGEELRVGQARPNCRYCRLLRRQLGYEQACLQLDARQRQQAQTMDEALVYECHGGMTEAILPLRVDSRLLGFVMIGQFRMRIAPPTAILRKARAKGVGRATLEKVFGQTPVFSPAQIRHLLGLVELLVQFIGDRRLVELKDVLGPILTRLREHPECHLSLSEAALLVGRSPTTLSHLFRRRLGRSYRELRTETLLARADELARRVPSIRVSEVAARLGFQDALYFSRLYRKHRGQPPTQAWKMWQEETR